MSELLRVLVVDDDAVDRLTIRRHLDRSGLVISLAEAENAGVAGHLIRSNAFDVVLLDHFLPDSTGLEFLDTLHAAVERKQMPAIIVLTGLNDDDVGIAAMKRGAEDYLVKQEVQSAVLKRAIRHAIERRRLRSELDDKTARLEELSKKLATLATTDELTQIANNRGLRERMSALLAEGRRGRHFAYVMADIDKFKSFNDRFGHQAGDEVLREVAAVMKRCVRETDFVARYGGEEMAILFVDLDERGAADRAERVRRAVSELVTAHGPVTASFGVAAFGSDIASCEQLIEHADAALYAAKERGRNCVVRFSLMSS